MSDLRRYGSSKALFRALTQQAHKMGVTPEAAHAGFIFERFVARVGAVDDSWVLKGGGAMLTRVIDTRATSDLDFAARRCSMSALRETLERICAHDAGDDFVFTLLDLRTDVEHEYDGGQMASATVGVSILGVPRQKNLDLDITFNVLMTQPPEIVRRGPAPRPDGFESPPVRLYPIVDHLADKVCATAQTYKNGASTRVRDLVDICVIALEVDVDGADLMTAIAAEWDARDLGGTPTFAVPSSFTEAKYDHHAMQARSCREHAATLAEGTLLATAFLAPVLDGTAGGMVWRSASRRWVSRDGAFMV